MSTAEQVPISFDWDGVRLAGSLHFPSGAGPHPAVVMAQGSGPADRDADGFFVPIREAFVDHGLATFAFDKPGCGESTGDWRHYGLEARAAQVLEALGVVRNHPGIIDDRVGIWGHSQGGWIVQKLAGRQSSLAFAIANSGPSISVEQQILYDCEHTIRNDGYGQEGVRDALTLTRALVDAASNGADYESICEQVLQPASAQPWYSSYPPIDNASDWTHFKLLISEAHEPLSDLKRVSCAFLAVYGGLDTLLPPWQGAQESGTALAEAASPDVTVVVFPRGNHRIQDPDTKEFIDGYLTLLGAWTGNRVRDSR